MRERLEQHVTKREKAYTRSYLQESYQLVADGTDRCLALVSKQLPLSSSFQRGRP